jgi:hypothetical protein
MIGVERKANIMWRIFKSYWWRNFWYEQIDSRFFPRQKWLIKKIPRTFCDKDILWEICILEGIKHYVEKDYGLGYDIGDYEFSQNDPEFPEHQKKFDKEVKENYDLIKIELPRLELLLEKKWDKIPHYDLDDINNPKKTYEERYGEVDRIEKEIDDIKTRIMVWAISKRNCIWT